ncbi:MAG: hypothetical protein M3285_11855 [Actinomycetota bacterium]|nr:hypothetical protein [Actinomycetota bacterium]
MSRKEALYQSLASAGATLIAFIGVIPEYAGHLIFPWAPAAVGGAIAWQALGVFAIVAGVFSLAGTLRLIKFLVIALALIGAAMAIGLAVLAQILYGEFH